VHFAAFELYSRRQRPLLMLQALNRAATIDVATVPLSPDAQATHPRLHSLRVRFLHLHCKLDTMPAKVAAVVRNGAASPHLTDCQSCPHTLERCPMRRQLTMHSLLHTKVCSTHPP
jgi:hypothetical protein